MKTVRFKKDDHRAKLPTRGSEKASGLDLYSIDTRTLKAGERYTFDTGLSIELPEGYEAQVRSRSGMASKHGVFVLNSPGTVDEDYRGRMKVILFNSNPPATKRHFLVEEGMRIAQLVIQPIERFEPEWVEELSETERGEDGFGSTGLT